MQTAVVVGSEGAVGKALCTVLGRVHKVIPVDLKIEYCPPFPAVDFLHIAIPYSFERFIPAFEEYTEAFKPTATIIHSTVPIGTTRKLGAIHSPIVGQHDRLEESLTTFTKFISAATESRKNLQGAVDHLSAAGIPMFEPFDVPEETEALKLLCSLRLYNDLAFYEFAETVMNKHGFEKNLVRVWTTHYNIGHEYMGLDRFIRPELSFPEGKVGGHIVENVKMLSEEFDLSFLAELDK